MLLKIETKAAIKICGCLNSIVTMIIVIIEIENEDGAAIDCGRSAHVSSIVLVSRIFIMVSICIVVVLSLIHI